MVVPKAIKFFGKPFRTEIEVTQVEPLSPAIFNVVVDAVVRADLLKVCGLQEAHQRFGWAEDEQMFSPMRTTSTYQGATPSGYRRH